MISNISYLFDFLFNPLIWFMALGLAFVSRWIWFVFRFPILWLTVSLFSFAFFGGEMNEQKEDALFLTVFIIVLISTLLLKPINSTSKFKQMTDTIGEDLHRQIYTALQTNEGIAGRNLTELMATGYIFGYINFFIEDKKINESLHEDIFNTILNGVLPKRLEEIFIRNSARYEIAKTTGGLEYEEENFNKGCKWGSYDASRSDSGSEPESLVSILLGEKPRVSLKKYKFGGE